MKSILITGASGALGSALVPLLAADHQSRVVLLMRAQSPAHLAQRQEQLFHFLRDIGLDAESEQRIEVLQGDISEPELGLAPEHVKRLDRQITHIVHAAGNVKLNQPLDQARKTAVASAQYIVDLTKRCVQAGQFQKLEFVSTVGVAGRRTGLIREERFSERREASDFHNTYEASKWQAEQILWEEIDGGLPATIHRPSMIVGDSQHGRIIHFQVFYHLMEFINGRRTFGIVPDTEEAVLDIIPVDYVAQAICLASLNCLGTGEVWHLCSGPQRTLPLAQLSLRIREMLSARGETSPSLQHLSRADFRNKLKQLTNSASDSQKRFLAGLPYLLDYLDSVQIFDNSITNATLSAHNLKIPAVESYLETVMTKFWDRSKNAKV